MTPDETIFERPSGSVRLLANLGAHPTLPIGRMFGEPAFRIEIMYAEKISAEARYP